MSNELDRIGDECFTECKSHVKLENKSKEKKQSVLPFESIPIPADIIYSGLLGIMGIAEIKLYICLVKRANYLTGDGYTWRNQIITDTGISNNYIWDHIKKLEAYKLLSGARQSKRKGWIRYKLTHYGTDTKSTT